MKKTLVLILLLFFSSGSGEAWALSDAEYQRLLATSPQFKTADEELNRVWGEARKILPKETYKALLYSQSIWLDRREYRATCLVDKDFSLADAYTLLTNERVGKIQNYLKEHVRNRVVRFTGKITPGVGWRSGIRHICGNDESGSGRCLGFWSPQDQVLSICANGDICTVVGTLCIDRDEFVTIEHVSLGGGEDPEVKALHGSTASVDDNRKNLSLSYWDIRSLEIHEERLFKELERIEKLASDLME